MLNRILSVTSLFLLVTVVSAAQTQSPEAETLRQILIELRAIHQDLRVSASTQFLLAELQLQQGIVTHAMQDTDNARTTLTGIHQDQQQIAAELDTLQNKLDTAANADERNAISQDIEVHKSHLAGLKSAERDWNSTLLDMQERLRNAQNTLADIESKLSSTIAQRSVASDAGKQIGDLDSEMPVGHGFVESIAASTTPSELLRAYPANRS
jgi:peptidoglycan hydrolase CwlO-like protein